MNIAVVVTAIPDTDMLATLERIDGDVLGDEIVLDPSAAFTPQMTRH